MTAKPARVPARPPAPARAGDAGRLSASNDGRIRAAGCAAVHRALAGLAPVEPDTSSLARLCAALGQDGTAP